MCGESSKDNQRKSFSIKDHLSCRNLQFTEQIGCNCNNYIRMSKLLRRFDDFNNKEIFASRGTVLMKSDLHPRLAPESFMYLLLTLFRRTKGTR